MMKRSIVAALFVALVGAVVSTAHAAKVGDKLYIKAKNTKVLSKPKLTSKAVGILQPGQQVVWRGPVKKRRSFHKVAFGGKRGIVYRTALSTQPPSEERMQSGQMVNAQAFASSGAATKALGSGAKAYGEKNNLGEAAESIEALEALAKSVKTDKIAKHVRKYKLSPNVGAGR